MGIERHRQEDLELQTRAWNLRVRGWTQERVAAELGITQQRVSRLLAKTEKRLYSEFADHAEEIKARQTVQLEHLYDRLTTQFEASCDDGSGNPALLAQALKALEDVRKIWGLEAPKRQEVSGPAGGAIVLDVEQTRGELQRRLARLAACELAEEVPGDPLAAGAGDVTVRLELLAPAESV